MKRKEIRRIKCTSCSGKGFLEHPIELVCDKCKGHEWYGNPNHETICECCDGVGRKKDNTKSSCTNCKGRGHFVKIFEITEHKKKCNDCPKPYHSDGCFNAESHEEVECPTCIDGTDPNFEECSFCQGSLTYKGWPCTYCGETGIVSRGSESRSNKHSSKLLPCPTCKGRTKILKLIICSKCNGDGFYIKRTEKDVTPKAD